MIPKENQKKFEILNRFRETLSYVVRFKNKVFTIALDIHCFIKCDQLALIKDLMMLRACGIQLLVVIGSLKHSKQKEEELIREQIGQVKCQISNLVYSLSSQTKIDSSIIRFCYRETNFKVNKESIYIDENTNPIILIPCIDVEGNILISLTQAVGVLAKSVGANKLVFLTDYNGIYKTDKTLLYQASPNEISELVKNKTITGTLGDISQVAIEAVQKGIDRVHIIEPSGLLIEIYDKDGIGTMIYQGSYQDIKRACKSDITGIMNLLSCYAGTGLVRQIGCSDIEKKLEGFFVSTIDDQVISCGCIQNFPEEKKGFISSVAVNPACIRKGIGSQMITVIKKYAKELGIELITLVGTRSGNWWLNQEFQHGCFGDLPKTIKAMYGDSSEHTVLITRP